MYYVYCIESERYPGKKYIGYTTDIDKRLVAHNKGSSQYTSAYKPWKLSSYTAFTNKKQALSFELYLKSHSGRSFAQKRFF